MIAYLDMDGVLCGFVEGFRRAVGMSKEQLYERWTPGNWWIHEHLGITKDDFWGIIDQGGSRFWSELDKTEDCDKILDIVGKSNYSQVVLMTSPPYNPAATAGKVEWIKRNLPQFSRKFAVTPCKEAFAHPNAVLIDDSDEGLKKFTAAGGKGILVCRRWNSGHSLPDGKLLEYHSEEKDQ